MHGPVSTPKPGHLWSSPEPDPARSHPAVAPDAASAPGGPEYLYHPLPAACVPCHHLAEYYCTDSPTAASFVELPLQPQRLSLRWAAPRAALPHLTNASVPAAALAEARMPPRRAATPQPNSPALPSAMQVLDLGRRRALSSVAASPAATRHQLSLHPRPPADTDATPLLSMPSRHPVPPMTAEPPRLPDARCRCPRRRAWWLMVSAARPTSTGTPRVSHHVSNRAAALRSTTLCCHASIRSSTKWPWLPAPCTGRERRPPIVNLRNPASRCTRHTQTHTHTHSAHPKSSKTRQNTENMR